jgi:hypothetical protein
MKTILFLSLILIFIFNFKLYEHETYEKIDMLKLYQIREQFVEKGNFGKYQKLNILK